MRSGWLLALVVVAGLLVLLLGSRPGAPAAIVPSAATATAALPSILDANPAVKRAYDQGRGRSLDQTQTVDGVPVTLRWAGFDGQHLVLFLTVIEPADTAVMLYLEANHMSLTRPGAAALPEAGDDCSVVGNDVECLLRYDLGQASLEQGLMLRLDIARLGALAGVALSPPPGPGPYRFDFTLPAEVFQSPTPATATPVATAINDASSRSGCGVT